MKKHPDFTGCLDEILTPIDHSSSCLNPEGGFLLRKCLVSEPLQLINESLFILYNFVHEQKGRDSGAVWKLTKIPVWSQPGNLPTFQEVNVSTFDMFPTQLGDNINLNWSKFEFPSLFDLIIFYNSKPTGTRYWQLKQVPFFSYDMSFCFCDCLEKKKTKKNVQSCAGNGEMISMIRPQKKNSPVLHRAASIIQNAACPTFDQKKDGQTMIPSKLVKKSANNQEQLTIQLELHSPPGPYENSRIFGKHWGADKPTSLEQYKSLHLAFSHWNTDQSHSKLPKTWPPTMWKIDCKVLMWLILRELCEVQRVLSCLLCLFLPRPLSDVGKEIVNNPFEWHQGEKNRSRLLFVQ